MTSSLDLKLLHLSHPLNQAEKPTGLYAAQAPFRAGRGRSGDTLVLHLALDGSAQFGTKQHFKLVKSLGEIYFKASGSSTLVMKTVAERIHDILVERNKRGANRSLQSAGLLTQAVFRSDRLYLAQSGPTHSLLVNSAGLSHYYLSNLEWRGLGFNRVPEINYHQVQLYPGDILLISPDLPSAWTADLLTQLRGLPLDGMVSKLILKAGLDFEAVLICLEPGSGKLNIVEPGSIDALQNIPDNFERAKVLGDEIQDGGVLSPAVSTGLDGAVSGVRDKAPQGLPVRVQTSSDVPGTKLPGLPRWVWSLAVGVLLVGIVGLYLIFNQGIPGSSPDTLSQVMATSSLPPTIPHTPMPSLTQLVSETSTILPPTPTQTYLPPSPTPTTSPTMENSLGSTQISPVDGMIMVYVPSGTFLMGAAEDDPNALLKERPQHTVNLDAFWIDQTEVTNSQHAQCVAAGDCRLPYSQTSFSRRLYYDVPEFADYPVVFISWNDAQEYCQWAGRRLPTEAEWEYAARGHDGRIYPWGNELDCEHANYSYCQEDTADVNSFPVGASPFGALNMTGNVWEWVSDWYYYTYYDISPLDNPSGPNTGLYRAVRGGSWYDDPIYLRSSSRYRYFPENSRFSVGFRCAITEGP